MNVCRCLLNSVQKTSLSRRLAGKLFQIRGPAAANLCLQNDSEHEWQSTFSPMRTWGSEQNFMRRDEYRQPVASTLDYISSTMCIIIIIIIIICYNPRAGIVFGRDTCGYVPVCGSVTQWSELRPQCSNSWSEWACCASHCRFSCNILIAVFQWWLHCTVWSRDFYDNSRLLLQSRVYDSHGDLQKWRQPEVEVTCASQSCDGTTRE